MDSYNVVRRVVLTEKSTALRESSNQYVFEVTVSANKIEVARAVERLFKVRVVSVRLLNVAGKLVRIAKFGGRVYGRKSSWKKAIVRLSPDSKIDVVEGL